MEKEIKINVPNGYEIDKENSTFECTKFKPIEKKLPKTWEEYCETHSKRKGESWINELSVIISVDKFDKFKRDCIKDKNILPNKEYAESILALCQLIQLRDCYNNGWVPDWSEDSIVKYCIEIYGDAVIKGIHYENSRILAFKTDIIRDEFLNNFKDLIEIAKPLI